MSYHKMHWCIDWCVIILFIASILGVSITTFLWDKVFHLAPMIVFVALGILFLNHISIKDCFRSKDMDFFLIVGGAFLSIINMICVKSRVGAFFTIADFLLVVYLADKIKFDKVQVGAIAASCFLIWFYWQFINFVCLTAKRSLDFHCRGVIVALSAWVFTYFFLPKRRPTIYLVVGLSLLFPVIYVLLSESGMVDGIIVYGKRFANGRDLIWSEFLRYLYTIQLQVLVPTLI